MSGNLSITLRIDNNVIAQMEGPYTMPTKGTQAGRAFGKVAMERLRMLFPGKDDAVKDMKVLRAQESDKHESVVLIFKVPRTRAEQEEGSGRNVMALQGVIFTIPSDDMELYAAGGGQQTANAGKPPSVSTPKKAAVAPAVVKVVDTTPAPPKYDNPSSLSDEESPLSLPPPPPDDTDAPSSPEIEEGKSGRSESLQKTKLRPTNEVSPPPSSPPSSPPPPPRPQPTLVVLDSSSQNRQSFSAEDLQKKQLRKAPINSDDKKKDITTTSLSKSSNQKTLENALLKRNKSLESDEDDGGDDDVEDDDNEWTAAAIGSQPNPSLFSSIAGSVSLDCDASNLAHVTGLAMALEYRAATGDARVKTADMEHVTSIIQEYARNPHFDATAAEVPLHVSTAIYTALDVLSQ